MTIDEEQRYYLGLTDSVFKTVEDAYENIFNCEDSIESLLEIAATIFSYPEFLMLLNDYEKLQSYAAEFENIVAKLNRPLTVLDSTTVIALDKVIDKINVLLYFYHTLFLLHLVIYLFHNMLLPYVFLLNNL